MAAIHTVEPGWYSIRGAAIYTGFSVTAIRDAMKQEKFPVKRVAISGSGSSTSARIKREHLDAWIEGRPIEGHDPSPIEELAPS